jgi:hypothetical protein
LIGLIADLFWGEHRLIVTADNAMLIGNELMKIAIVVIEAVSYPGLHLSTFENLRSKIKR